MIFSTADWVGCALYDLFRYPSFWEKAQCGSGALIVRVLMVSRGQGVFSSSLHYDKTGDVERQGNVPYM